ncbi:MAG: hypothetical protein WCJ30_20870 [Deltaproteobacteria bacterium]
MTALQQTQTTRRETPEDYRATDPRPLTEFRLYAPRAGDPDWPRLSLLIWRDLAPRLLALLPGRPARPHGP